MALTDKAREFLEKRRAAFEENKALETDVVAPRTPTRETKRTQES